MRRHGVRHHVIVFENAIHGRAYRERVLGELPRQTPDDGRDGVGAVVSDGAHDVIGGTFFGGAAR